MNIEIKMRGVLVNIEERIASLNMCPGLSFKDRYPALD